MHIMVVTAGKNKGTLSLRMGFVDTSGGKVPMKVSITGIGGKEPFLVAEKEGLREEAPVQARNFAEAAALSMEKMLSPQGGIVQSLREIDAMAHRFVHGGEKFKNHCVVDEPVMDGIRECIPLAPLENPYSLITLEASLELAPGVLHLALFETSFHRTLPDYAYVYGIPYEYYVKFGIRRFGFHGMLHHFLALEAEKFLARPAAELRLITCVAGEGASMAAVRGGKSIDTSMGFTPLEGLFMDTRCGDIDPSIVTFLMEKNGFSYHEIRQVLNEKSGLAGISGISGNADELMAAVEEGSYKAKLALDIFCYRFKKYVGAYIAALGGLDALVVTGDPALASFVGKRCTAGLECLGINRDENKEPSDRAPCDMASPESAVRIFVVPCQEEMAMAREAEKVLESRA
ncbi:MAG: acetate/propionate family kinase [Candidatus Eremiobacteraeota bacterium]|nr:acetate/propionate family kinase [Candidatus Eremiobacteraeota bacterium]